MCRFSADQNQLLNGVNGVSGVRPVQGLRIGYSHPEHAESILCVGTCTKHMFECLKEAD